MSEFKSNLKLGATAYVCIGHPEPFVKAMVVGQIGIIRTLPGYNSDGKVYKEEAMCHETGIGSGSVYTYGEHIFKTREDAEAGCKKIAQKNYKQIQEAAAWKKKKDEEDKDRELRQLEALKRKYEVIL